MKKIGLILTAVLFLISNDSKAYCQMTEESNNSRELLAKMPFWQYPWAVYRTSKYKAYNSKTGFWDNANHALESEDYNYHWWTYNVDDFADKNARLMAQAVADDKTKEALNFSKLVDGGFNYKSKSGFTVLLLACERYLFKYKQAIISKKAGASLATIKILLENGGNPNASLFYSPLALACTNVNSIDLNLVKLLLDYQANPNGTINNLSALACACASTQDVTVPQLLLAKGALPNITANSDSPMWQACANASHVSANTQILDLLLAHKAFIDPVDDSGQTPALSACLGLNSFHGYDVVLYLIEHGANIWHYDKDGATIGNAAYAFQQNKYFNCESQDTQNYVNKVIKFLQARNYPWPPPSPQNVLELVKSKNWPPKN